jgi:endonuclease III
MSFNFERVFRTLEKYYEPIPLEVFGTSSYKTLISTLLSSRTRDEVTLEASNRLFKAAPNIYKLNKLEPSEISKLIYPVGFYNTKAKHLKKLAEVITKEFDGKVPTTQKDLTSLPGVGIKTANLVLNRAFNIPAIAVDTHVHRITNLLGWVKTSSPEKTEKELSKVLPKRYWNRINRLLVSVGRKYPGKKKLSEFLKKLN